jgi:tRNA (adenine57-N1/adenine58-N1)-methyltransferase
MLPKDIGLVIAYTGMNHNDAVLDAGTGSGIAAIYFGGIAKTVKTYEVRPEFSALAQKNISEAKLKNVEAIAADFITADGDFDIVHLDMQILPEHVNHAFTLLNSGGYLACYTPFLEQMAIVIDAASGQFTEIHTHELIEREMTRSKRGTRPSTSVCHSGYITIARK